MAVGKGKRLKKKQLERVSNLPTGRVLGIKIGDFGEVSHEEVQTAAGGHDVQEFKFQGEQALRPTRCQVMGCGRLLNMTAPYCSAHLGSVARLCVRPTVNGAGLGLFVYHPDGSGYVFLPGDDLLQYLGDASNDPVPTPGPYQSGNFSRQSSGTCPYSIHSATLRSAASFINIPGKERKANCRFVTTSKRAEDGKAVYPVVRALAPLRHGDEVLIAYGGSFGSRANFDNCVHEPQAKYNSFSTCPASSSSGRSSSSSGRSSSSSSGRSSSSSSGRSSSSSSGLVERKNSVGRERKTPFGVGEFTQQLASLDPSRGLVLFDVHGTLSDRADSMLRPGAWSLMLLPELGLQWGLCSNGHADRVHRTAWHLYESFGLQPDLIWTAEQSSKPPQDYRLKYPELFRGSKVKNLVVVLDTFIAKGGQVVVVDDTPAKIIDQERFLVPVRSWDPGKPENGTVLEEAVTLAANRVSGRPVEGIMWDVGPVHNDLPIEVPPPSPDLPGRFFVVHTTLPPAWPDGGGQWAAAPQVLLRDETDSRHTRVCYRSFGTRPPGREELKRTLYRLATREQRYFPSEVEALHQGGNDVQILTFPRGEPAGGVDTPVKLFGEPPGISAGTGEILVSIPAPPLPSAFNVKDRTRLGGGVELCPDTSGNWFVRKAQPPAPNQAKYRLVENKLPPNLRWWMLLFRVRSALRQKANSVEVKTDWEAPEWVRTDFQLDDGGLVSIARRKTLRTVSSAGRILKAALRNWLHVRCSITEPWGGPEFTFLVPQHAFGSGAGPAQVRVLLGRKLQQMVAKPYH